MGKAAGRKAGRVEDHPAVLIGKFYQSALQTADTDTPKTKTPAAGCPSRGASPFVCLAVYLLANSMVRWRLVRRRVGPPITGRFARKTEGVELHASGAEILRFVHFSLDCL
jgi:hypothetical protein